MRLLVTYLERFEPPAEHAALAMPPGALALEAERLTVEAYLTLYREIGGPYSWDQRLRLPHETLAAFLAAETTRTFVLREEGRPVGLCEFDRFRGEDVELTHFGLVPAVYGRRLGPFLLDAGLRAAWGPATRRIWLHTDTNDHPKAMATYGRAGFKPYMQRMEEFPD
ncbi:GNAT family N-acetyltransferase [Shinella sp. G-2]|uniref:GNAT family N-acetyltransferase n=1 Tax=Shinella sp. G-2 TaxID=3133141 RepID=UPI003D0517EF